MKVEEFSDYIKDINFDLLAKSWEEDDVDLYI